ncbi:hypothetical protein BDF22DRAFT_743705 [Syncephalis plumigaleata]|nr:hypothetical protein BDF22DRAFT_743705 [Syncephalis plumigaleata]
MAPPTVFSYQERSKPVHARSCCCCTCLVCCIIFFILLVGVALTLFFLWPRIPDVQYMGLQTLKEPQFDDKSFSGKYNAIVQINNPNSVGWTLESIDIEVIDRAEDKRIGNGTLADVVIEKKSVANITIPIDISYSGEKNDPEVARLKAICIPGTPIPALIKAPIAVKGLNWIHMPPIKKEITITYPNKS